MIDAGFGSSPGKIILLGVYSVVFGEPAIAAAIGRRLEVRVRRVRPGSRQAMPSSRKIVVAARELGLDARRCPSKCVSIPPPVGSPACFGRRSASRWFVPSRTSPVWSPPPTTCAGMPVESRTSSTVPPRARTSPRRGTVTSSGSSAAIRRGSNGYGRASRSISSSRRAASCAAPRVRSAGFATLRGSPGVVRQVLRLAGDLVRRSAPEDADWETLGALMDAGQGLLNGFGGLDADPRAHDRIARGPGRSARSRRRGVA